ncbi:MAG TPA: dolichyl-phosphate beta-glucosyltransferase [Acidimicrobiales bacterium]|nr:dolichyl-phosphate beta-glucosyltransferase [Acidimicrobiales bacterium]
MRRDDARAPGVSDGTVCDDAPPVLDVVIPVYNEERVLERSVRRLRAHLDADLPWASVVTVVDNGSTDATSAVADRLAASLPGVRVRHLVEKGRGLSLRTAWGTSDAQIVAYMDVDLSTALSALLPLVAPLVSGHSDVAIGSRLARGARVVRGPKRELISRAYNLILRTVLGNGFTDAQCGFKAVRADVVRRLLPDVADNEWFFDTELLVLAERSTLRIHEVPVDWVDDPDSRVDIAQTARDDLRGVLRLWRDPRHTAARGRDAVGTSTEGPSFDARFVRVGAASTLAYLVLFCALRPVLGAFGANALALAGTTVANIAAHRRSTLSCGGPVGKRRLVVAGTCAYVSSVGIASLGLLALAAAGHDPDRAGTLLVCAVLVAASGLAVLVRFVALHAWMFHGSREAAADAGARLSRIPVVPATGSGPLPSEELAPVREENP